MCPVGFLMTETAVGIRCAGERPGMGREGGMVAPPRTSWSPAPGREGPENTQPEGTALLLFHRNLWAGVEVTGDQTVAASRELPHMGQEDKDKDSANVIGAVTKEVQDAGLTEDHGARTGVS